MKLRNPAREHQLLSYKVQIINAILTIDLKSASDTQRDTFYEYISAPWEKTNLTTTWVATFPESLTQQHIITKTLFVLEIAAIAIGVKYEAVIAVTPTKPTIFNGPNS
ncbi:hypothetical protein Plim_2109 [Planctopirus limnophila DSM 3776]|uniref:Uncharacterized protein n=1 Tax=Planctopirus limnophila (strain ATCC 43296 / DSM 3776 / IFAM 1008 / Mu 290) TaxID=521674 RepID=D5SMN1_PLAL2|nr:hypothetical protein Plim_2109 [Planctopirus limnophila DSM 3776]